MSYTDLWTHYIFSTKDRAALITPDIQVRLCQYIGGIAKAQKCHLVEAGGMSDHVHLLVRMHASVGPAELMRLVKANSTKWVHDTFPDAPAFRWQRAYGAFTVSRSAVERTRAYIRGQEEHHRRMTFQEEFIRFLERHRIEYDPRYIWE